MVKIDKIVARDQVKLNLSVQEWKDNLKSTLNYLFCFDLNLNLN